jgi:hypothetical protein
VRALKVAKQCWPIRLLEIEKAASMPQSQFVGDLELSINNISAKSPTRASLAALLGRGAGRREPQLRHSKTLRDFKAGREWDGLPKCAL